METSSTIVCVAIAVVCVIFLFLLFRQEKFTTVLDATYKYTPVILSDDITVPVQTNFSAPKSQYEPLPIMNLLDPPRTTYTSYKSDPTYGSGATHLNADDKYFADWVHGVFPGRNEPNQYVCGIAPSLPQCPARGSYCYDN
jgi:hypothetical protein